jgi:hypothetical protein
LSDNRFIAFISERRYGLAATLLLHMLVVVVILFVRVKTAGEMEENVVYVDLKTFENLQKLEAFEPKPERRMSQAEREARNIAVNQAEDRIEKYDDYKNYQVADRRVSDRAAKREVDKRISQTIKDIIKEDNLNPDDKELPKTEKKPIDFYQATKNEEQQVYQGPTNIYYKLENRKVANLPVPVYKCKGGATVQVDIRVGQRGKVEWTTINSAGTDTRDPCFLDAAKEAARQTRFNFSTNAPLLQEGYIIYHFVAQ